MSYDANVRVVEPYVPGEQPDRPGMIKLNTNECPYPPAPGVEEVLRQFPIDKMRLYPDPEAAALTQAIADYYHVGRDQVFVGVGSDDVLAMSFLTFVNGNKPILFPDITYSFYDVWANLYRIPFETQALDEQFRIKKEDYIRDCGGIIIPNPNAPTGVLEGLDTFEEIVKANPDVVVIIDEAYVDFGGTSCLPLVEKYDNVLVVQTFSKSRAMAGIRIGFAIGNPRLIKYLNDVKFSFNSYTMNALSLAVGVKSIEEDAYFKESVDKVVRTREKAKQRLREMGFSFPDSYSKFLFVTHREKKAVDLFNALRERDIFVRYFRQSRIDNYLRISIGTDEQMEAVYAALEEILQ
ncbi:MAG: histidinol-phosphate transaminase [Lachnospiraceae bacterium]|nr:histidinol-phosphate transaminase [Lachnospiraceae bacterium]